MLFVHRKGNPTELKIKKIFPLFVSVGVLLLWANDAKICRGQSQLTTEQLLNDLACSTCHFGISAESDIHDKTPNLNHAGLRFNPAYLFDYLQKPTRVRRHIGLSRMPNFFFNPKEALALTLYLEKQNQVEGQRPDYPAALRSYQAKPLDKKEVAEARKILIAELRCTNCHTLEGEGENASIDLSSLGYRLGPEWVQQYLAAPHLFDGTKTAMPSFFYQLDASQEKFAAMLPRPDETIKLITQYLFSLNIDKREQLRKAFEKARSDYPQIDASLGEKIFLSQNCTACHRHAAFSFLTIKNAPDLSSEGGRVKREWLEAYLQTPKPIRPFGFYPGSGSRMPDFKLADIEIKILGDYLLEQKPAVASTFQVKKLSAFAMKKAQTLLQEKLSCLGCHQLGEEGGRIGPNLSSLKKRLQPDFVYQFMQNPHTLQPETVMPKILMPQKTLELVANFLLQQDISTNEASYLSLVDHSVYAPHGQNEAESLYLKYCAACHGVNGDGKGYNATYLPKTPASHADKSSMSQRPDDTLFDGVYAGGYILNKHHFMPPWGQTLSNDEIRKLVVHMRNLCQCEGPRWAE